MTSPIDPNDPIEAVHDSVGNDIASTIARELTRASMRSPLPISTVIDISIHTAYSIGLEIGVAIAVTDVAAARRLRSWMTSALLNDNPRAIADRDLQAGEFLAVLDQSAAH